MASKETTSLKRKQELADLSDRFYDFLSFVFEKGRKSRLTINDEFLENLRQTAIKENAIQEKPKLVGRGPQIAVSMDERQMAYQALEKWVQTNLRDEKFVVTEKSVMAAVALFNAFESAESPSDFSRKLDRWISSEPSLR